MLKESLGMFFLFYHKNVCCVYPLQSPLIDTFVMSMLNIPSFIEERKRL